jgi:ATP-dependent exoDNAse (exonuclease V) beta subunit
VALTCAKRTLHVYIHPRAREADGQQTLSPAANSLLHTLWPALEAGLEGFSVIGDDEPPEEILPAVTQSRKRLVSHPAPIAPPADVLARGEIVPVVADEEIEFSWARQTARRVGTVVHEALERFGTELPTLAELPRLRTRLESRLEALGVEPDAARAGAERALTALRATLEDANGRWLFDAAHRDAHSELALTGVRGGQVVNAVIDRTFVDDQGTRWIVDFKTSPHEGGDLALFLDSEAARYETQLKRYAHLARELGPEPVRAGLYFPLLSAWREVDVGS